MDEFDYSLNCPSCDVIIEMKVHHEDEHPVFCPMCGEDVNEDWKSININE